MNNTGFTRTRDTLTPDLAKKIGAMKNPQRAARAMGTVFASLAKRSFNDASLRPLPWQPLRAATVKAKKRAGLSEEILRAHGRLAQSPRVKSVTKDSVTVTSDAPYARYHQLGTKNIPARPFFPVKADGTLTDQARKLVRAAAVRAIEAEMK